MLKGWYSIKEIEIYLLCEILISKDTLQDQKKLLRASLNSVGKRDLGLKTTWFAVECK